MQGRFNKIIDRLNSEKEVDPDHSVQGTRYLQLVDDFWYVAGLVFEYLKDMGGLPAMAEINQRKANKLYAAIDESDLYSNPVDRDCRSWMNVPFVLQDSALDSKFLAAADTAGLKNLKGHRLIGGIRASIYNAMPEAGVDALIDFMREFEKANI